MRDNDSILNAIEVCKSVLSLYTWRYLFLDGKKYLRILKRLGFYTPGRLLKKTT
jgi:hypothetical protein